MWYIGLDVHAETTTVAIRSGRGAVVLRTVVPTTAIALRKAIARARGQVLVACEAGPLAPWVKRVLQTARRSVVVCDRRRTRFGAPGGGKTDRFDAERLSECLRMGSFHTVYVPDGARMDLRQYLLHYWRMMEDRRRVVQRLQSLFLESAVHVRGLGKSRKRPPTRKLLAGASRNVARAYLQQLELATEAVALARQTLVSAAAADPVFALLQTVPYIGEIRAAALLGIVSCSGRFPGRRKFWSYCGLGVIQKASAEHQIKNGQVVRGQRPYGVRRATSGHPLLKKVLSDIALHASVGRGELRAIFERHLARGKRPSVARLALARKIAAIVLAVWKSGRPYNPALV